MTVQPRNYWKESFDFVSAVAIGAKMLAEVIAPITASAAAFWLAFHASTNVWCQRLLIMAAVFELLSFIRYLKALSKRLR